MRAQDDAGNDAPVDVVWAWVVVYGPDDEGVATLNLPAVGPLPCVSGVEGSLERLGPLIRVAAANTGRAHELRRYVLDRGAGDGGVVQVVPGRS